MPKLTHQEFDKMVEEALNEPMPSPTDGRALLDKVLGKAKERKENTKAEAS